MDEVTINRINIKELVDILSEMYDKGARFVDFLVQADSKQDTFGILVREEYIDKENNKFTEQDFINPEDMRIDVSGMDFNDLAV